MITDLLIFIASCAGLMIAGGLLVKSLTKLSQFLRLSEFVVSFVIMAFSTSIPELFVGITSALIGMPAIALGTVIGSNIADLTLVTGITALLGKGIKAKSSLIKKDAYWMLGIAILAVVLMYLGKELSRIDGIILLAVFLLYMYQMVRNRQNYGLKLKDHVKPWQGIGYFILFALLVPALYFIAKYVVSSGTNLATELMLPPLFVGLFFIAFGTSLPELAFETRAILLKKPSLALGDIIGSVVINTTIVLGVTALISPITGSLFLFLTSSFFMIVICAMFAVFLESYSKITWKEGTILLMMYVLFLIVELTLKGYYL